MSFFSAHSEVSPGVLSPSRMLHFLFSLILPFLVHPHSPTTELHLIGREDALMPERYFGWLEQSRITALVLPAAVCRAYLLERTAAFRGLRFLAVGGEAVDPTLAALMLSLPAEFRMSVAKRLEWGSGCLLHEGGEA